MNNFEVVIGIEIHVELKTKTKMFSASKIDFNAEPNTCANQIDLAYPGTLPLVNKQAVKYAIALAKALNMEIDTELHFDRKNYFYPDLPKGYQITQFFRPIGKNGVIDIKIQNQIKQIKIERIHLEEDTARQYHDEDGTKLDYNRAGIPLIEIVTFPVLRSAKEASAYVDMIKKTVSTLEISEGKLEQGSLRADVNISLRPFGSKILGTKVEIKNLNSLSNIERAIEYEIKLQKEKILTGQIIQQETKRFDDQLNVNKTMRVKTGTVEYKYFPEPNIPFIKLSNEFVDSIELPELPNEKEKRYYEQKIQNIYIQSLIDDIELSKYFDNIQYPDKEKLSKIFFAEVVSLANSKSKKAYELNIDTENILKAIILLDQGIISGKSLKKLIPLLVNFNGEIRDLLKEYNLEQISDPKLIESKLNAIIFTNEDIVIEYPDRPEKVVKFILGNLMKETGGQINPILSNEILLRILDAKFK
ncbi:Asp-tRNA(Asn)/Glu-tRNA(Gln) amidotransferase subunit GatB [Mycoplasmopsis cynos]|uniref:Aspartyl/glutamyl-tRNA(Asn/Gln) amidotransferase subunit B n=1 Tax=Mycoplasmopsis cynos TaxID=171284 RepID=A0ABD8AK73_9BACT|nr:Asp-tRNA(Asn)/Glu-tRNA(Gln) amidotransferase subunit GatB [Mycoplasmopsis cynos]MCU9934878.1 Asp-tRNA(Asn)/Glu-tRNA(Gln) amidotransferase subunit GatB [Mycoplasmopsis cynos]WAM09089.1 Asp-tRNA(Asn)/Glu-tRNA(Gln) amidotransferase subunit GatB [Mycoplasmopsis cynos]WQQ20254.1 Asp-tRNA(Asn)/Glu-tRNA(Gln) amidotransferase subunit GatB [Mycoplasmopsis cynos]